MSAIEDFKGKVTTHIRQAIRRNEEYIQEAMAKELLELKDEDFITCLRSVKDGTIGVQYVDLCMPMNVVLFTACQSEAVCRWLADNAHLEDEGVLEEHIEELEDADHSDAAAAAELAWKRPLVSRWIAHQRNFYSVE